MIGRKKNWKLVVMFGAISLLLGSLAAGTAGVAQAVFIQEEEHWKYNIDKWTWDGERRRTIGLITPQVIIQNETADRLEGYIADANGTRMDLYDDHYVHVRYLSNISANSGWEISGKADGGLFAIDIPERYRDAEVIRIYVSNNHYTVDNATPTTPETEVDINAAQLTYKTNPNLEVVAIAEIEEEEPQPLRSVYDRGSLIDWVLSRNGLLPVGSSDAGE